MTVTTSKFVRKPFHVDAVQVTAENMEEVAAWCQGEIRTDEATEANPGAKYIHVRVHRPLNDNQTKAFAGNWVLYAGNGYKVYTDKAFKSCFQAEAPKPTAPSGGVQATTEAAVDGIENDAAVQAGKPVE